MGGCATKPKVSKGGDVGESPASAPEPAKEEAVAVAASETNAVETSVALPETVEKKDEATATAVVVVQEGGGGRGEHNEGVKEIVVEDDKVDVQVSKRRSLGLLFNKEVISDSSFRLFFNEFEKALRSIFHQSKQDYRRSVGYLEEMGTFRCLRF